MSTVNMLTSFVIFTLCASVIGSQTQTSVNTTLGTINGKIHPLRIKGVDYSVKTFLGIPYAKPPVGERRFKKTEVLTSMQEPLDAFDFGAACEQLPPPIASPHVYNFMSEDCLFLNIYSPVKSQIKERGYAVMVYIHGGGFMYDSAEIFSGDVISALNDVIVVIINYRVGIFGFMSLGVPDGMGNTGFWDQHVALQWVNKHISAFGGDNRRVTLFGESAGGQSAIYQAFFSGNDGLFQRIISESGNPPLFQNNSLTFTLDPSGQMEYLTRNLGCDRSSLDDKVTCLQALNTSTIMSKLKELSTNVLNQPELRFSPCVDGELIKTYPANLRDKTDSGFIDDFKFYRSLDMMSGFNNREGALFAILFLPDPEQFQPALEDFYNIYVPLILQIPSMKTTPLITDFVRAEYTNFTARRDNVSAVRGQYLQLWLDIIYSIGTLSFARVHANSSTAGGSTYVYRFSVSPSNRVVPVPSWVQGANHGDELPFVFGFSKEMEHTLFSNYTTPADWEVDLSHKMMTYWANFAKSGDPNTPRTVSPVWPTYDNTNQAYVELEETISEDSIKRHLQADKLDFWLNVYPALLNYVQAVNGQCV